ncbi:MAG: TetR/AcrR family transcriptional regulator [Pontibacterium sp.]
MSVSDQPQKPKPRSKSEEKRENILRSATALFLRQGFAVTTMDQVADQAGVSKQTVYSHFGGKDTLFKSCIEKRCDQNPALSGHDFDFDDLQRSFEQLLYAFTDLICSPEAISVHRICAAEAETTPQLSQLFYNAGPLRVKTEMSHLMEEIQRRKLLTIDEPYEAGLQLLAMVQGDLKLRYELNIEPLPTQEERYAFVKKCVAVFLKGYGK